MTHGTLTVLDVFDRVKRTFGDESGVQITEEDIIRWINDAQREAVMQNEGLLQTTGFIDTVEGTGTYSLPEDCFVLHHVYVRDSLTTSYYAVKWFAVAEFNQMMDGWDGSGYEGFPQFYTSRFSGSNAGGTPSNLELFPIPDKSITQGLKLVYSRYATDVTSSTDHLDVPPFLHSYIVNFCLMQAYEMDENWEAADKKASQIQGDLDFNNNRHLWFGRETYPTISTNYEDL